eukprot:767410-Hanusia_phi.AAC.2
MMGKLLAPMVTDHREDSVKRLAAWQENPDYPRTASAIQSCLTGGARLSLIIIPSHNFLSSLWPGRAARPRPGP